MEQNKFDAQVKATLESRRLQPSPNAWEKLSNRLDENTKASSNNKFWYLGIAASIIGVLLVSIPFFKADPIIPKIVVNPTDDSNPSIKIPVETVNVSNTKDVIVLSEQQPKPSTQNVKLPDTKSTITVVKTPVLPKQAIVQPKTLNFEEQKIQDLVAKVEDLKSKNQEITNEMIETLLLEAEKEIRIKRLINTKTTVVDANTLLEEVETDLDQSFRSRVFDAIKASFGTVKTVIAQRNN